MRDLISWRIRDRNVGWKLLALILVVIQAVVLCGRMSHPWTYNDDYNGAFWAQAARNLGKAGFLANAGVPAPLYFGSPPIPADALYVHHPTFLADMMAADRALLGESEAAARAAPIFFSLLTSILLWSYTSYCLGVRTATFALAMYIAQPMELHYGQMVNFEAPELFFLLAALCCFNLWRARRDGRLAAGLYILSALALATDWQGYLLIIFLALQLAGRRHAGYRRMAVTLLLLGLASGILFLAQIRLADAGAWQELFHALKERVSQTDVSGVAFTSAQWLQKVLNDLTTLYTPLAWIIAAAGAVVAYLPRRRTAPMEWMPRNIAGTLFLIGALYVRGLRNQSYIHDFAGFYFLIPIAIFSGIFFDQLLDYLDTRILRRRLACAVTVCLVPAALIYFGIRKLENIDTQFCILDDDESEPVNLIPHLGHVIDGALPADALVLSNFDRYYSPLPYYAQREMINGLRTYGEWQGAIADAKPQPVGGIVWTGDPEAGELLSHLPPSEKAKVVVDNIPFVLWKPAPQH